MNVLLQAGWSWYPSVVIGLSLWTALYVWAARSEHAPRGRSIFFHLGTGVVLLALVSPLDELGDEYLFSAHMAQHLLLMFAAPPLWLAGAPRRTLDRLFGGRLNLPFRRLTSPATAALVFVSVLYFWHLSAFYTLALEHEAVHVLEHLSFLGAALIAWWPVAGPETSRLPKPAPPVRMLYLFLLTIPCTALAAVLTFAKAPLYPFYTHTVHLPGLDALADQRLGGLLMWLPTHLVLLGALGHTFLRWFQSPGENPLQTPV